MNPGIRAALVKREQSRLQLSAILQEQYAEERRKRFFWRVLFSLVILFLIFRAFRGAALPGENLRLPNYQAIRSEFNNGSDILQLLKRQNNENRKVASTSNEQPSEVKQDFLQEQIPSRLLSEIQRETKKQAPNTKAEFTDPNPTQAKKVPEIKMAMKSEYRASDRKDISRSEMLKRSLGATKLEDKYIWLEKIPPRYAQDK